MNSSKLSQTSNTGTGREQAGSVEAMGGASGQITKVLSRRRSYRHQWHIIEVIFILLFDALLVTLAFTAAYNLRYKVLFNNNNLLHFIRKILSGVTLSPHGKDVFAPYSSFVSLKRSEERSSPASSATLHCCDASRGGRAPSSSASRAATRAWWGCRFTRRPTSCDYSASRFLDYPQKRRTQMTQMKADHCGRPS